MSAYISLKDIYQCEKKKTNIILTIITEYLNEQRSKYALGQTYQDYEYGKVLNVAGFSLYERYTAFWIYQNMP